MGKRFLTYFILALVVFQSAAGIGDVHKLHQSGTEHLMFDDHHHELEASEINHSHADKSEDHEMDCHHCCHCHGHLSPAILIKSLGFTLNKSPTSLLDYSESFSSEIINPLLRPPIAHT